MKANYYGEVLKENPMAQWEYNDSYSSHRRLITDLDFCKEVFERPEFRMRLINKFEKSELIYTTENDILLKENSLIKFEGKEVMIKQAIYNPQTDTMDYYTDYCIHIIKATDDEKNKKLEDIRTEGKYYLDRLANKENNKISFWKKIFK